MKHQKCISLFFGFLVIIMFSTAIAQERHRNTDITITGMITNIDKAKEYITDKSFLQLIPLLDGKIQFVVKYGRLIYVSELPKSNIPTDGHINFHVASLKPGNYFLTAQLLEMRKERWPLRKKDGKLAVINIPEILNKLPIMDFGDVIIPVP